MLQVFLTGLTKLDYKKDKYAKFKNFVGNDYGSCEAKFFHWLFEAQNVTLLPNLCDTSEMFLFDSETCIRK